MEKDVYSVGELARRFGVSSESLRNWERSGELKDVARTPGGHRRYTQEHVRVLAGMLGVPATMKVPR